MALDLLTPGHGEIQRSDIEKDIVAELPHLRLFARSLTRNFVAADDLVQNTVLKALTHLDRFEPGTNLRSWLFTIMRNTFYSDLRRSRREVQDVDGEHSRRLVAVETMDSEEKIDAAHKFLLIALLHRDHADIYIAVDYLEMSYEQAAAIFEVAVGTIKSRVNRCRRQLYQYVADGVSVESLSIDSWATATKNVPRSHPYFPVARGYEQLYAYVVERVGHLLVHTPAKAKSEEDLAWETLVASGALDEE